MLNERTIAVAVNYQGKTTMKFDKAGVFGLPEPCQEDRNTKVYEVDRSSMKLLRAHAIRDFRAASVLAMGTETMVGSESFWRRARCTGSRRCFERIRREPLRHCGSLIVAGPIRLACLAVLPVRGFERTPRTADTACADGASFHVGVGEPPCPTMALGRRNRSCISDSHAVFLNRSPSARSASTCTVIATFQPHIWARMSSGR